MKKNYLSLNIKHLLQSENIGKDAFGKLFGLNRGTIGSYIDNNSKPKLETLQKISERYKVSIDELINKDLTEKNTYYPNPVGVLERFSPDHTGTNNQIDPYSELEKDTIIKYQEELILKLKAISQDYEKRLTVVERMIEAFRLKIQIDTEIEKTKKESSSKKAEQS